MMQQKENGARGLNDDQKAFLTEYRGLLTCSECHQLLNEPLTSSGSCPHTFCKECIDEYLTDDSYCPRCKSVLQPADLKKNPSMASVLDSFQNLLNVLDKHGLGPPQASPPPVAQSAKAAVLQQPESPPPPTAPLPHLAYAVTHETQDPFDFGPMGMEEEGAEDGGEEGGGAEAGGGMSPVEEKDVGEDKDEEVIVIEEEQEARYEEMDQLSHLFPAREIETKEHGPPDQQEEQQEMEKEKEKGSDSDDELFQLKTTPMELRHLLNYTGGGARPPTSLETQLWEKDLIDAAAETEQKGDETEGEDQAEERTSPTCTPGGPSAAAAVGAAASNAVEMDEEVEVIDVEKRIGEQQEEEEDGEAFAKKMSLQQEGEDMDMQHGDDGALEEEEEEEMDNEEELPPFLQAGPRLPPSSSKAPSSSPRSSLKLSQQQGQEEEDFEVVDLTDTPPRKDEYIPQQQQQDLAPIFGKNGGRSYTGSMGEASRDGQWLSRGRTSHPPPLKKRPYATGSLSTSSRRSSIKAASRPKDQSTISQCWGGELKRKERDAPDGAASSARAAKQSRPSSRGSSSFSTTPSEECIILDDDNSPPKQGGGGVKWENHDHSTPIGLSSEATLVCGGDSPGGSTPESYRARHNKAQQQQQQQQQQEGEQNAMIKEAPPASSPHEQEGVEKEGAEESLKSGDGREELIGQLSRKVDSSTPPTMPAVEVEVIGEAPTQKEEEQQQEEDMVVVDKEEAGEGYEEQVGEAMEGLEQPPALETSESIVMPPAPLPHRNRSQALSHISEDLLADALDISYMDLDTGAEEIVHQPVEQKQPPQEQQQQQQRQQDQEQQQQLQGEVESVPVLPPPSPNGAMLPPPAPSIPSREITLESTKPSPPAASSLKEDDHTDVEGVLIPPTQGGPSHPLPLHPQQRPRQTVVESQAIMGHEEEEAAVESMAMEEEEEEEEEKIEIRVIVPATQGVPASRRLPPKAAAHKQKVIESQFPGPLEDDSQEQQQGLYEHGFDIENGGDAVAAGGEALRAGEVGKIGQAAEGIAFAEIIVPPSPPRVHQSGGAAMRKSPVRDTQRPSLPPGPSLGASSAGFLSPILGLGLGHSMMASSSSMMEQQSLPLLPPPSSDLGSPLHGSRSTLDYQGLRGDIHSLCEGIQAAEGSELREQLRCKVHEMMMRRTSLASTSSMNPDGGGTGIDQSSDATPSYLLEGEARGRRGKSDTEVLRGGLPQQQQQEKAKEERIVIAIECAEDQLKNVLEENWKMLGLSVSGRMTSSTTHLAIDLPERKKGLPMDLPKPTPAYLEALLRGLVVTTVRALWDSLEEYERLKREERDASKIQAKDALVDFQQHWASEVAQSQWEKRQSGRETYLLAGYHVILHGNFLSKGFPRSVLERLVQLAGGVVVPYVDHLEVGGEEQHGGKHLIIEAKGCLEPYDMSGFSTTSTRGGQQQQPALDMKVMREEAFLSSIQQMELQGMD